MIVAPRSMQRQVVERRRLVSTSSSTSRQYAVQPAFRAGSRRTIGRCSACLLRSRREPRYFSTPARALPRFSKSWVTPAGTRTNEPAAACVHSSPSRKLIVPSMTKRRRPPRGMRTGPARVRLEPPLGDRVAAGGLGAVGLEERRDTAHRVAAAFAGPKHDRHARCSHSPTATPAARVASASMLSRYAIHCAAHSRG